MNEQRFEPALRAMENALASERGVILTLDTVAEAIKLAQMCHQLRISIRRNNRNLPHDDPKYDSSPYDSLRVSRKENTVEIRPYDTIEFNIKKL